MSSSSRNFLLLSKFSFELSNSRSRNFLLDFFTEKKRTNCLIYLLTRDPDEKLKPPEKRISIMGKAFEHGLVWSGVFEIFFVGGIFYGWPAFIYVLKKEDVFYELCENGTARG